MESCYELKKMDISRQTNLFKTFYISSEFYYIYKRKLKLTQLFNFQLEKVHGT